MLRIVTCLALAASAAIIGSSAFAADVPRPIKPIVVAPPPPSISGYLGLYLGETRWNNDRGDTGSNFLFGGDARVAWFLEPGKSLQLDTQGEATTRYVDANPGNSDDGRINGMIGGHLSWRDASHLWGGFGALSYANNLGEEGSMTHGILGGEVQGYFGNMTLYAQAGGAWAFGSPTGEDIPTNLWFVRGVGRWFHTPNDKLQAEIGYASASSLVGAPGSKSNTLNWGGLWEHKSASGPLSLFVAYDGFYYAGLENCRAKPTEHILAIGVRLYFNQNTLLAVDRNGATLDLPKFNRAFSWTDVANDNTSCF